MKTRELIKRRLRPDGDRLNGTVSSGDAAPPRRRLTVGAAGVVALVVALLVVGPFGGDGERRSGEGRRDIRSATVKRQTLVARESVEGTLGYSGRRAVVNRLVTGGGASGGGEAGGGKGPSGGGSNGGGGGSNAGRSGSAAGSGTASGSSADSGSDAGASAAQSNEQRGSGRRRSQGDRGTKGGRDAKGRGAQAGGAGGSKAGGGGSGGNPASGGGAAAGDSGGADNAGAGGSARSDRGGRAGDGGSAAQGSGTVTRLAREGSIVDRGETLYELDNRPVVLMYGSVPAYRKLSTATTNGPDVRQLERNLSALGFGSGVTVDEHFTAATAAAVRRWQRSLGLPETGEVELGRVVFLPGARRIGSHSIKLGNVAGTGSEVLDTTSTKRVVTVELDVAKQSLVRRGDTVTVTLPDGRQVSGRIARVGRVARQKDEGDGAGGDGAPGASGSGSGELVIDLAIVLRSRRGVSRLDQAPATVGIAQETRRRVLAVPVTALLARPGGGYGVEVVRGGRRRIVAVETGLFANGLVEISGRGIAEGTKVAIPEDV